MAALQKLVSLGILEGNELQNKNLDCHLFPIVCLISILTGCVFAHASLPPFTEQRLVACLATLSASIVIQTRFQHCQNHRKQNLVLALLVWFVGSCVLAHLMQHLFVNQFQIQNIFFPSAEIFISLMAICSWLFPTMFINFSRAKTEARNSATYPVIREWIAWFIIPTTLLAVVRVATPFVESFGASIIYVIAIVGGGLMLWGLPKLILIVGTVGFAGKADHSIANETITDATLQSFRKKRIQIRIWNIVHSANAFAFRGFGGDVSIAVTSTLYSILDVDELTMIVCHENAHLERRHGLFRLFALLVPFATAWCFDRAFHLGWFSSESLNLQLSWPGVIMMLVALTVSLKLFQLASWQGEFEADRDAVGAMAKDNRVNISEATASYVQLLSKMNYLNGVEDNANSLTHPNLEQRHRRLLIHFNPHRGETSLGQSSV
ncbi:MAG: M48 family metalloprotease [Pirellulaceae bacterium]